MAPANLFDEEDDELQQPPIRINFAFAARLQHNKEREELHRLRERNPAAAANLVVQGALAADVSDPDATDGSSSSDDDSEDAADAMGDKEFLSALLRIRQGDAALYDPNLKLFGDEAHPQPQPTGHNRTGMSRSPMYLKDVVAQQAIAKAADGDWSDDDANGPSIPTHNEEQQELKRSFLLQFVHVQAAQEAGEGGDEDAAFGGILRPKAEAAERMKAASRQERELLDQVFADDGDDGDRFLKQYLAQRAWADDEDVAVSPLQDQAGDLEEDDVYLERADEFEAAYNHRYQAKSLLLTWTLILGAGTYATFFTREPGGGRIVTYSRGVEGLVRKPDDRRKAARKRKAERLEQAAQEQQAELKRLKNLKRAELMSQVATLQRVSGHNESSALSKVMQGDFDPEAYDAAMAAAFDEEYYEEGDYDNDVIEYVHEDAALEAAPSKLDGANDKAASVEQGKQEQLRVTSLLEDYFKLDYEDKVAGIACRFHYKQVPAANYGLDVLDVLGLDQKELNQVVGIKKLAPYREDGGLARPNYAKLRELKQHGQAATRHDRKCSKRRKAAEQAGPPPAGVEDSSTKSDSKTLQVAASAGRATGASDDQQLRQRRLDSYAPLTLRKTDAGSGRGASQARGSQKSVVGGVPNAPSPQAATTSLTRAQKKNMRRSEKRRLRSSHVEMRRK